MSIQRARAHSYGSIAADYAAYRPGYSDAAIDWMLAPLAELTGGVALDLGAGTGKLTEPLVRRGFETTAVEPDAAMLGELSKLLPSVRALIGTAEAIPIPDDAVDVVLVGAALHWFDRARALAEIARVLRPGGVLGVLTNPYDDRVPWVARFAEMATAATYLRAQHITEPFADAAGFHTFQTKLFDHAVTATVDELVGMAATLSTNIIMPEPRRTELLAAIRDYLSALPEARSGSFDMPMVIDAHRTVRVG